MTLLRRMPDWLLVALLALFARLFNLGGENIWYDEAFTAWVAQLDPASMWAAITGDVHPPLWYLVERVNIAVLGQSEFVLRLPAALFGVASVMLVWLIAHELRFDRRTALVCGVIAAILPGALYYAQDARMYPMLATFVLLGALGVMRRNWILFAVGATGAVYSQNLGMFYVAALGLAALWFNRRSPARPMLALACIVVAWMPWGVTMLHQTADISDGFWIQPLTLIGALYPLGTMTIGWRFSEPFQMHVYAAALGATMTGLIVARRWLFTRRGLIVLAVTFGAPMLLAVVSVVWRSVYLPRALLPSAMLIPLIWGWMLTHMSTPNRRAAQLVLVPVLVAGMAAHYLNYGGRQDVRSWLTPVREQWRDGDVIWHSAIHTVISFSYYVPGKPYLLRPLVSDLNQTLSEPTKAAMGFPQANFDDIASLGYRRAWLLIYTNPMSSADEHVEIDRILSRYPAQLVAREGNDYAEMLIYLVPLQNGVARNDQSD